MYSLPFIYLFFAGTRTDTLHTLFYGVEKMEIIQKEHYYYSWWTKNETEVGCNAVCVSVEVSFHHVASFVKYGIKVAFLLP